MKLTLPSQASLDKVAPLDPWGALPNVLQHPDASDPPHLPEAPQLSESRQLLEAVTSQAAVHASDALAFPPFSQHPQHPSGHTEFESGQLSIHMPPPAMGPPHAGGASGGPITPMVRNESDAMSTDDGGMSGGFAGVGGFSGLAAIPAQPPLSALTSSGVTQAAVFTWTHQEYCASNTLREMTCVEARVRCHMHAVHDYDSASACLVFSPIVLKHSKAERLFMCLRCGFVQLQLCSRRITCSVIRMLLHVKT